MKQEKIIDPFVFWLPVVCVGAFVGSGLIELAVNKIALLNALLGQLLPLIWIIFLVSGVGELVCLIVLLVKHNLKDYLCSFNPTFDFHESLKIYPKYSEYKDRQQYLNIVESMFNSCARSSYVWKTSNSIKFVIQVPRSSEAHEILAKKLPNLRSDIVARYSQYSFDGKFVQIGSYCVLEGSC